MNQFVRTTKGARIRLRKNNLLSRLSRPAFAGLFLVAAVPGSAKAASPSLPGLVKTSNSSLKPAAPTPHHWYQVGKASWYGSQFQGRKTATGEKFDMNQLTCAHRSLPLGTWLRVTNLHNKKIVYVRVSDRGPEPEDRIVDLSYAAAHAVGIEGLGQVRLDRMAPDDPNLAKALLAQMPTLTPFFFPSR